MIDVQRPLPDWCVVNVGLCDWQHPTDVEVRRWPYEWVRSDWLYFGWIVSPDGVRYILGLPVSCWYLGMRVTGEASHHAVAIRVWIELVIFVIEVPLYNSRITRHSV